jgi:hypothetical protein
MIFDGVVLTVHVKWNASLWYDEDPYGICLKYMSGGALENPTKGNPRISDATCCM